MSTKPAVLLNAVESFLRAKYSDTTGIQTHQEGMESQVFTFRRGAQKFILRLNETDWGFRKDALCFEKFGSLLPIPAIVETGKFSTDLSYCISEFMEGVTVEETAVAQLPALAPSVQKMQTTISQLPTTDLVGFGSFGPDGNAAHATWRGYLQSVSKSLDWSSYEGLSTSEADLLNKAKIRYEDLIPLCPEMRAIYHGDFGSNNVLVRGTAVVAIIDWDCCGVGDPLIDVADTYYWTPHLDCMRVQAAYSQRTLSALPNYQQRILCYQLKTGLEEVQEDLEADTPPEMPKWHIKRLEDILESIT